MTQPQARRVAVVGAGTIGASWAAYFLGRGFEVAVSDPVASAASVQRRIDAAWPALERLGVAPGAAPDRMRFTNDALEAVEGADFVQENGPEDEALKVELFARLDAALPLETVVASSSSGLLMSRIQSRCAHPERTVIGHPFNPPHLMPLVEVVGGRLTSPGTIERALSFYRSVGKMPIHIRTELRGHVANRLQAALWREAIHLVERGVVSVADADAAVAYGPGLRWAIMGPSLTFHLGGGEGGMRHFIEHLGPAVESWWDDLGTPSLSPEVQEKLVAGVLDETGGASIADLARERDDAIVNVRRALRR